MKAQAESSRGSSRKAAPPTRPLHDCAYCFLSGLKRAFNRMPFPIGPLLGTVDRWTHPLTDCLEHHGLCILAAVDDKVSAMGSFAEGCMFCTATRVEKVLSLLHTRGIIGTSACVWVKYEGIVKEDIQKAVHIANKIPLVNYVTPVVCTVSSPLAMAVSDWLLKQAGQQVEKSTDTDIDTVDNHNLVVAKQELEAERPNTEKEALRGISATSVVGMDARDVHFGGGEDVDMDDSIKHGRTDASRDDLVEPLSGKDVDMDDSIKHGQTDASKDDFVEQLSGKDVNIDDEVLKETLNVHDSIVKDDVQLADTILADVNADDGAQAAEKMPDRPLRSTAEAARSLPDVLEMIESSWLQGHSSSSPPQRTRTSRARSDGVNTFKKLFFG